jgi:hypothetical protein
MVGGWALKITALVNVDSNAATFNPLDYLQYGALGLVIVALLTGYLWTKPSVERLVEDKKRAEEQRDAIFKTFQEQVIPLMASSTESIKAVIPVIRDAVEIIDNFNRENRRRPGER